MKGEITPNSEAQSGSNQTENSSFLNKDSKISPKPEKPISPQKKHLIRNLASTLSAIAIAGSSGLALQYHMENNTKTDPPGIMQDIKGIPSTAGKDIDALLADFGLRAKKQETTQTTQTTQTTETTQTTHTVDKTFPKQLDTSSFTPISQADAATEMQNMQLSNMQNNTIQMYLPIDQETLDSSPNLGYNQQFIGDLPSYVNQAKLETVNNLTQINGLPDGTIVYAPVGGTISLNDIAGQSTGTPEGGYFTSSYSAVIIDLTDKDGTPIRIGLSVLGGIPLLDLSKATYGDSSTTVTAGQPLFKISYANSMKGVALSGEAGQVDIVANCKQENPPSPIPLAIDFLKGVISQ